MRTPELIRRVTARREEIEKAREVLASINQYPVVKEQAEQQHEADEACRNIRNDCEDLLNARGKVDRHRLAPMITINTPFGKGRVFKSSIQDDKGERVEVMVFSTKQNPSESKEIIVGIGDIKIDEPFLSLGINHGTIKVLVPTISRYGGAYQYSIRRANLQDAREWKEVVDALKEQSITGQSLPIEHK